jgi:hypothetical protein
MVKVRFVNKDSRILPEMSAKVAFLSRLVRAEEEKPRTALNQTALVDRKDGKKVFLVKGDRVVVTPVSLGRSMGDMVEVLGGVKVGDRVVLSPSNKLRDGSKIKIEEK